MAQRRRAGVVTVLMLAGAIAACQTSPAPAVSWVLEPVAASDADVRVTVEIRDGAAGPPLSGARLVVEAHMPHPGMPPVVAPMSQTGVSGEYASQLKLTMAGNWTLVLSGTLPDGRRVTSEHKATIGSTAPAP
jgi:hypothetical protein